MFKNGGVRTPDNQNNEKPYFWAGLEKPGVNKSEDITHRRQNSGGFQNKSRIGHSISLQSKMYESDLDIEKVKERLMKSDSEREAVFSESGDSQA